MVDLNSAGPPWAETETWELPHSDAFELLDDPLRHFGLASSRDRGVAAAPPTPAPIPRVIGARYQVVRRLGGGAMGCVLLARDVCDGTLLAIKRPLTLDPSPWERRRLERESEIARSLAHPGVVRVGEVGEDERGLPFLPMEYVAGRSLEDVIEGLRRDPQPGRRRPFAWRARVVLRLANALAHTHARGVVHCDVKPANVVLTASARAVLIDWGLAKRGTREPCLRHRLRGARDRHPTVAGTPLFMAPEALRGAVSPQTDVFSLAALLYQLLALRHYLPGAPCRDYATLARRVDEAQPVPADELVIPGQRPVPHALARICTRGLQKDPTQRYESVTALAADLERWLSAHATGSVAPRPRTARSRTP